ncbi:fungal-specific transcription factor domain-containing protein [Xylogone sp. PMI_703]|nr:fungal-specific transcription factor domain-containing protein [Xylogone sp. PMI_703]
MDNSKPIQRHTRRRIPLSCSACRVRKLKCNREQPCQNCIVRGDASCSYAEKAPVKKPQNGNSSTDVGHVWNRILRLENTIREAMAGEAETVSCPTPTSLSPEGSVDTKSSTKSYSDAQSKRWDVIMQDLNSLKAIWDRGEDRPPSKAILPPQGHRPSMLTGLTTPPDRVTIMSSLPSREATDKLVERFFKDNNPCIPTKGVIHRPTFLKQYYAFWEDPSKTTIIWIGLLYSILCLAMQSYQHHNDEPPEYRDTLPVLAELYRIRTAQCITIADISKPCEFMIEALLFHSYGEYGDQAEGDKGSWLMSATLMRLALQQGYHRDPSKHPNISIFQAEMRRRLWLSVCHHELMFAVQIGLPKAVRYAECDTQMPNNLFDDEIFEDMKELPPSRPLTEITDLTYHIVKSNIMTAYGHIIEHLQAITPQPYEEVMRLDAMIMEAQATVPPELQLLPLEEMRNDPSGIVLERFMLQSTYNKALCVLHRKYWNFSPVDRSEPIFYYSRRACMTAAINLLNIQAAMHQATLPGGPLEGMKWYHFQVPNHDYLLGAILLCLEVKNCYDNYICSGSVKELECDGLEISATEKLKTLQQSIDIWADVAPYSNDAAKYVTILSAVVQKIFHKDRGFLDKDSTAHNDSDIAVSLNINVNKEGTFGKYSWDKYGLGIPLLSTLPTGNNTLQDNIFESWGVLNTFCDDMSQKEQLDLDWTSWDQFITGV